MAKIDSKTIGHLGVLARIGLSKQEASKLQTDINSIVGYVAKLQQVDTANTKPTSQVTGLEDVWRADEPYAKAWDTKALLSNAPATEDSYIKVKRVIE